MARFTNRHAASKPDVAALTDDRGSTTWADLDRRVNQLIHGLRHNGMASGDTIAVFAGNCREYFEIICATGHAGVLFVPVNWHFSADELNYVIEDSGAKLLIVEDQFQLVADSAGAPVPTFVIRGGGDNDYETLLADQPATEPDDQTLGGPMFYTSGTTGRPKGVRSSGTSASTPIEVMDMMGAGMSQMLSIPADGRTLLCGPVYHSAQWAFSYLPLVNGCSVVMRHRFDEEECLSIIDDQKITNVHLVPTQFHRFLRLPDAVRDSFSGASLQVVWHGAAPCPPKAKQQMVDWWGPVVNEYYGSTEGSIVSTITADEWRQRPGSVGKASPTVEITIRDDDGAEVPTGTSGQIYVKNLMGSDFEYHNEPDKTAAVHLEPGVFTFGDIGYFDSDGYLFLSDRKIDMIISGGVNIYPAEIEAALLEHPAVEDAAVFGIPDDEFGEQVKAAVTLRQGTPSTELEAALIQHCRDHLAGYKAPKSVDFETEMPRHETGKLYKRLLRDKYWANEERSI